MKKSCKYYFCRFNRFSKHMGASFTNFANKMFFFLDFIFVYFIQYLFVYNFGALTARDGKNTIKFRDYIDF